MIMDSSLFLVETFVCSFMPFLLTDSTRPPLRGLRSGTPPLASQQTHRQDPSYFKMADGAITLDSLLDAIDKKVCSNTVYGVWCWRACRVWSDVLMCPFAGTGVSLPCTDEIQAAG